MRTNDDLVAVVEKDKYYTRIKSPRDPRVLEALRQVDRRDFIPDRGFEAGIVDGELAKYFLDAYLQVIRLNSLTDIQLAGLPSGTAESIENQMSEGVNALANQLRLGNANWRDLAYSDKPLQIGYDQTCSQPSLVALMVDVLELEPGMKVLEVGTGCGYHAAVAYTTMKEEGTFVTIEYVEELHRFGKEKLEARFGENSGIQTIWGNGSKGFSSKGPYDRIYLAASADPSSDVVRNVKSQLNPNGGMLLYPVQVQGEPGFFRLLKRDGEDISRTDFTNAPITFVPLIE